jgi:AraC-like DNA-binding protein
LWLEAVMTAPAQLRRVEFTTSDQAEAREFIEQAYGGRLKLRPTQGSNWRVSLSKTDAEDFSTAEATLPADLTFKLTGRADFIVNTLLGGAVAHDQGKTSRRYQPGDVYLASWPGAEITSRTHDARMHAISLCAPMLAEVAAGAETAAGPPRFLSPRPLDGTARRWQETARFVSSLLADPDVATAPLLIAAAGRLLAATALTTFPNTAVTEPSATDRRDAHSRTMRRAISFIESNADREITVGDIAVAAHVTPRALQLAFRRHLDTTPMAYLRRVRLDHARRELDRARHGRGTTVSAVAYRWGFPSPSRFAEQYRAAYGELPSATLFR